MGTRGVGMGLGPVGFGEIAILTLPVPAGTASEADAAVYFCFGYGSQLLLQACAGQFKRRQRVADYQAKKFGSAGGKESTKSRRDR